MVRKFKLGYFLRIMHRESRVEHKFWERRKIGVVEFFCGNVFVVWGEKSWCRIGSLELKLVIKKFLDKGSYPTFLMGVIVE